MLAMTTFHGITMIPQWFDITHGLRATLSVSYLPAFTIGMFGMIGALMLFYLLLIWLSKIMSGDGSLNFRELAINYSYAFFLPSGP
jgi:hypothetical protein